MFSPNELKRGAEIILNGQPYEILEAKLMFKGRGHSVVQAKVKNLVTGTVTTPTFHPSDSFEEAELGKFEAKFLYFQPGEERYFFCQKDKPSKRFDLGVEQLGSQRLFLKPQQIVEAIVFQGRVINVSLPIKIQLKVTEAPPGIRGDRSQAGTKQVTLETGAKINVPLFVEEDELIEVNTETGEYVRRVGK